MQEAVTIVIFGAAVGADGQPSQTMRRRVAAAFAFGGVGVRYMPTGGAGRYGRPEAALMAELLMAAGVAAGRIEREETGTDTLSSAVACARLLGGRDRVYAASSLYHLPRCLMLLRMAGVAAQACPVGFRLEPYWMAREVAALPWDAWLMWRRRYAS